MRWLAGTWEVMAVSCLCKFRISLIDASVSNKAFEGNIVSRWNGFLAKWSNPHMKVLGAAFVTLMKMRSSSILRAVSGEESRRLPRHLLPKNALQGHWRNRR